MSSPLARLTAALADRYRLERELGQGGMATVYLAEDLKHRRQVAIKVLRPELSALLGAERFLKEIETTANLQHPHILPLFDSGSADGLLFYVMPYVSGESLRQKLTREKQLRVEEAVRIATQVANALDYAHRQNVIHRDIKPENILLSEGQALIADFGIALALRHAGGSRLTETGLSLGTPQYMSPEQATGDRQLDARSDIYSLGCVLYEMLAGEPPHTGPTVQAVIARVVNEEPRPITLQRKTVPPHVEAAVLTALEKLPADRFTTAAEFAEALGRPGPESKRAPGTGRSMVPRWGALALAGAVTLAAVGVATYATLHRAAKAPVLRYRSSHMPGEHFLFTGDGSTDVALSPDGRWMVYLGPADSGRVQLWLRDRSELHAVPLPGTRGGTRPVFSPDGARIAFGARSIRILPLAGGLPATLVDSGVDPGGLSWSDDGYIYYGTGRGIERIRPDGGPARLVFPLDTASGEVGQARYDALPDGRGIIYRSRTSGMTSSYRIMYGDPETGARKVLMPGIFARYAESGHLLVVTADGRLLAAPFDLGRQEVTGPSVVMAEGVAIKAFGAVDLALSRSGTLVYLPDPASGEIRTGTPVWVERGGRETPVMADWTVALGSSGGLALSPDGGRLAIGLSSGFESRVDIWVRQLPDGPLSRLTTGGGRNTEPFWSPDGRNVGFRSSRTSPASLWRKPADGSRDEEPVLVSPDPVGRAHWLADGRSLVMTRVSTEFSVVQPDIDLMVPPGDSIPQRLLASKVADEQNPAVAPDGKWLAYQSTESGRTEVYVRPFPDVGAGKWQVSLAGGREPRWGPSGRELFYRGQAWEVVSASVRGSGSEFRVTDRSVFVLPSPDGDAYYWDYDVHPDGQRLLMVRLQPRTESERPTLVVVENFFEELKAKVPR